ncbi:PIN domain-containing protein [Nostoc sp. CENA543]|uniref:PIN domain-containing protein n=1 Tax=Nostoc sp. CENA543 TaxID=1869241 RepID=UPI0012FFFB46|nr:PIN domain-containing protein [Nostoc sp. CENA543]
MRIVLFDSDVLLDVLAQRQPFVVVSAQALNMVTQPQVQGYISGHAVTNIFYILRRQVGSEVARELLSRLLQRLQVANVTDAVIRAALQSCIVDFEDAVTSDTNSQFAIRNSQLKNLDVARILGFTSVSDFS